MGEEGARTTGAKTTREKRRNEGVMAESRGASESKAIERLSPSWRTVETVGLNYWARVDRESEATTAKVIGGHLCAVEVVPIHW